MAGRHLRHGKFGLVQFNTSISHPVHDFPLLRPATRGPHGASLVLGYLLPLPGRSGASCFGGWERGCDGGSSSLLPPLLLLLLWLTSEASLSKHSGDMCGFFGVLHMRECQRSAPTSTSATHQLGLHCLHFPAWGTLLTCRLGSGGNVMYRRKEFLLLLIEPQRKCLVGAVCNVKHLSTPLSPSFI